MRPKKNLQICTLTDDQKEASEKMIRNNVSYTRFAELIRFWEEYVINKPIWNDLGNINNIHRVTDFVTTFQQPTHLYHVAD